MRVAGALIASLAVYGAVRLRALEAEIARAPRIAAGIVQADVARYGELARDLGRFDAVAKILEAHFALSHEALAHGELDLLLWPETVYPTTFGAPKSEDGAAFDRAIGAFVTQSGVALLFGAYDAEGGREYNAAVLLEPDGPERVRYRHLPQGGAVSAHRARAGVARTPARARAPSVAGHVDSPPSAAIARSRSARRPCAWRR